MESEVSVPWPRTLPGSEREQLERTVHCTRDTTRRPCKHPEAFRGAQPLRFYLLVQLLCCFTQLGQPGRRSKSVNI